MKDLNFDKIQDYFKELDEQPMGKFTKAGIYGRAKAWDDQMEKERIIRDYFDKLKYDILIDVYVINDNIQIAKCERKDNEEVHYHIFIDYKSINETTSNFDIALIMAISYKYTKNTLAGLYFGKMIDIKFRYKILGR
jgi:hypothetical protein